MEKRNTYSTSFLLRAAKGSKEEALVYCRITVDTQRTEFSIKKKIRRNLWKNGQAKTSSEEGRTINAYLKQVESEVFRLYREMLADRKNITAEALKNAYLGVEEKGHTLKELVAYHNEVMKHELAPGTQKNYFTTQKFVHEFLKDKRRTSDVFLDELNYKFIKDFELFLKNRKPKDHHKPCGQNGAMKHIERLRKMINLALKEEWISQDPFQKFKAKFVKNERGYLTLDELKLIEGKNLPINRLALVRDLFVFSCYTGLSYIEVSELTPGHLVKGMNGGLWIQGKRRKSGEFYKVPLLAKALAIIEQYKSDVRTEAHGRLFPVISNQKLNAYLKEIADLCEIEKNLTFHLARHTFATSVTLANGVPIESVSKMLGHSSIRTTQIYAKVVEEKLSCDMALLKEKLG